MGAMPLLEFMQASSNENMVQGNVSVLGYYDPNSWFQLDSLSTVAPESEDLQDIFRALDITYHPISRAACTTELNRQVLCPGEYDRSQHNQRPKRTRSAEPHKFYERRRRDRIRCKLRALQELIPNSHKPDRASILDDAILYLKTLKLQVEVTSSLCVLVRVCGLLIMGGCMYMYVACFASLKLKLFLIMGGCIGSIQSIKMPQFPAFGLTMPWPSGAEMVSMCCSADFPVISLPMAHLHPSLAESGLNLMSGHRNIPILQAQMPCIPLQPLPASTSTSTLLPTSAIESCTTTFSHSY